MKMTIFREGNKFGRGSRCSIPVDSKDYLEPVEWAGDPSGYTHTQMISCLPGLPVMLG